MEVVVMAILVELGLSCSRLAATIDGIGQVPRTGARTSWTPSQLPKHVPSTSKKPQPTPCFHLSMPDIQHPIYTKLGGRPPTDITPPPSSPAPS